MNKKKALKEAATSFGASKIIHIIILHRKDGFVNGKSEKSDAGTDRCRYRQGGIHFIDRLAGSYAHTIGVSRRIFDRRLVSYLDHWLEVMEEANNAT